MNINSNFDLRKFRDFLLTESLEQSSLQEMEVERLGIYDDIDNDVINGDWDSKDDIIDYLNSIIRYCNEEIRSVKLSNPDDLEENTSLEETLENDDIIYDRLVDMDHEQLVSTLLRTAEANPSITLEKFLNKYGSLEENTSLEEAASVRQITTALKDRNAPGDQEKLDIVQNAYKAALNQFDPATAQITDDGRLKGFGSVFKKNLPSKDYFEDLSVELELNPVFSTNTIEKNAANDLLGKTPNKPGKQADPNKPAAEPKVKAEKSPKLRITDPTAGEKPVAASFIDGGDEATDVEDIADEMAARKAAKGNKRLGNAATQLAQVTKEMKALIPAYQAAKGTPQEAAIVAQLKSLTAEKKALEVKVDDMFKGKEKQNADLMGGEEL